jgi:hypothetical protein
LSLDFVSLPCDNSGMRKRSSKKPAETPETESTDQPAPVVEPAAESQQESGEKNPAAVALGRLGGLKGGKARAKKLTAKERSEIAKKAAQARWANRNHSSSSSDGASG